MISVHSARGYPRFYRVGGAPGGPAHDAIIVSFAASLWGIIVGGEGFVVRTLSSTDASLQQSTELSKHSSRRPPLP